MGQWKPDGAEQVEAWLVGIEDASGDVEMGDGVAIVEHCVAAPTPEYGGERGGGAAGQDEEEFAR